MSLLHQVEQIKPTRSRSPPLATHKQELERRNWKLQLRSKSSRFRRPPPLQSKRASVQQRHKLATALSHPRIEHQSLTAKDTVVLGIQGTKETRSQHPTPNPNPSTIKTRRDEEVDAAEVETTSPPRSNGEETQIGSPPPLGRELPL
ncbi:hypothetical protein M0R45_028844 [Rubus argutus]|uniref:Uncharacterized protein n=1 Tax=Rubus argutus TaxID=59490 RepID=A0AAW1W8L4_RUBAR